MSEFTNMADKGIAIQDDKLIFRENVEKVYEKTATLFENSGKVDVAKKTSEGGFMSLY